MTKRTTVAAVTLVTLLIGVTMAASHSAALAMNPTVLTRGTDPAGAQWAYALGLQGNEALLFALVGAVECAFFSPAGSVACGLAGAL